MGIMLGKDAVFYVHGSYTGSELSDQCNAVTSGNQFVTTGWNEICEVKDLTINAQLSLADITDRCSAEGWRLQVGTLADGTIDTSMNYDPDTNGFDYLQKAYFNRDIFFAAIMDRDATVAVAEGLIAPMQVTNFTVNQPLEDAITVDLQFTLTRLTCNGSALFPTWTTLDLT